MHIIGRSEDGAPIHTTAVQRKGLPIRKIAIDLPRDSEPQDGTGRQDYMPSFSITKVPMGKYDHLTKAKEPEDLPWDNDISIAKKAKQVDFAFDNDASYNPFEEYNENIFAEDEGDPNFSIPAASRPGESTITLEERHAFESIFSDIYARTQAGTFNSSGKAAARAAQAKVDPENAKRRLAEIMNDAGEHAAADGALGSMSDLKSYPQALRAVAAQALGLTGKKPIKVTKKAEKIMTSQDDMRTKERLRVEALLHEAKSDVELWRVMEAEVFSMIPRLGLEDGKSRAPFKVKRGRKSAKQIAEEEAASKELALEEPKLDMATYSPLYPHLLLFALRLLSTAFSKPSSLVLNVLPRIKSLGLASHILGASTPFYNELMRVHYYTFDDFKGVSRLLNEMLNSGMEMNEETYGVVTDILKVKGRVGRDEGGGESALGRLYSMPQYFGGGGSNGFLGWRRAIGRDLEAKGIQIVELERKKMLASREEARLLEDHLA